MQAGHGELAHMILLDVAHQECAISTSTPMMDGMQSKPGVCLQVTFELTMAPLLSELIHSTKGHEVRLRAPAEHHNHDLKKTSFAEVAQYARTKTETVTGCCSPHPTTLAWPLRLQQRVAHLRRISVQCPLYHLAHYIVSCCILHWRHLLTCHQ